MRAHYTLSLKKEQNGIAFSQEDLRILFFYDESNIKKKGFLEF